MAYFQTASEHPEAAAEAADLLVLHCCLRSFELASRFAQLHDLTAPAQKWKRSAHLFGSQLEILVAAETADVVMADGRTSVSAMVVLEPYAAAF